MNVAMSLQTTNARLVSQFQSLLRRDLPDATEAQLWKLLLPRVHQGDRVAAGNGEEQFKILAVAQSAQERRLGICPRLKLCRAADGNGARQQFCARLARLQNVPQISRQSIAHVNHGVNGKM